MKVPPMTIYSTLSIEWPNCCSCRRRPLACKNGSYRARIARIDVGSYPVTARTVGTHVASYVNMRTTMRLAHHSYYSNPACCSNLRKHNYNFAVVITVLVFLPLSIYNKTNVYRLRFQFGQKQLSVRHWHGSDNINQLWLTLQTVFHRNSALQLVQVDIFSFLLCFD
ncbi:hypothetical protein T02_16268 [Trichinella nativa]|uniref:Uncharacterized protein n=1 Tax=Trichinella nativa TaxID=6335 RepID=A0A0V1LIA1_9BILA|nr:hypothetical protein T02_16268 [Trichinella nativa]